MIDLRQGFTSDPLKHGDGRMELDEESTISSPPLWRTSSQSNTPCPRPQPYTNHPHYRVVSSKRSQEIARDRQKLMEIFQDMPEGMCELSLKDLVEEPIIQGDEQIIVVEEKGEKSNDKYVIQSKLRNKKKFGQMDGLSRPGSMSDEHVILKMFTPTLGVKKGSKSRPLPKQSPRPHSTGEEKGVDKRWWEKKRFLAQTKGLNRRCCKNDCFPDDERKNNGSEPVVKRNSCHGTISRTAIGSLPGCWPFLLRKKR